MATLVVAATALPSAILAETATAPPGGGNVGATKTPAADMVPQAPDAWLLQAMLHTGLTAAPFTVAVNACWAPAASVSPAGFITMAGGLTVTVADAVLVVSPCAMAVTVSTFGFGAPAGAV